METTPGTTPERVLREEFAYLQRVGESRPWLDRRGSQRTETWYQLRSVANLWLDDFDDATSTVEHRLNFLTEYLRFNGIESDLARHVDAGYKLVRPVLRSMRKQIAGDPCGIVNFRYDAGIVVAVIKELCEKGIADLD